MFDYLLIVKAVLFAVLYGLFEADAAMKGWNAGKKILLDHFSWYHIRMLVMFIIACWPLFWIVPVGLLIEDIAFYTRNTKKELGPDSWVTWFWGGFWIKKQWIPNTYLMLAGFSVIFFFLFET